MRSFDDVVATCTQTCIACPVQYEGYLADGRRFYFRYRHGFASLGVGRTEDEAVGDSYGNEIEYGPAGWGWLDEGEFEPLFMRLYERIAPGHDPVER